MTRDNGTSGSGADQIEKSDRRGAPAMRGLDTRQEGMFSYVSPESRIPKDHPLRPIRELIDDVMGEVPASDGCSLQDADAPGGPLGLGRPENHHRALPSAWAVPRPSTST